MTYRRSTTFAVVLAALSLVNGCEERMPPAPPDLREAALPRRESPPANATLTSDTAITYARPVLVETPDGDLLAYAARTDDVPRTEIVMRRSTDSGHSWSDEMVTPRSPSAIDVARRRLISVQVHDHEGHTDDATLSIGELDGSTWSDPVRVEASQWDGGYRYHDIRGFGVQLRRSNAGRIVIPVIGYSPDHPVSAGAYLLLSDDGGTTFRVGARYDTGSHDVAARLTVVERTDGALLVYLAGATPAVLVSDDGGQSFASSSLAALPGDAAATPWAWLASYVAHDDRDTLLLGSLEGDGVGMWRSHDLGATWDPPVMVHLGPSEEVASIVSASGLGVLLHTVGRTVPSPGGSRMEHDLVITTVGLAWLDAPVCAVDCTVGARACDASGTRECVMEICPVWTAPQPACALGSRACIGGAISTCNEIDGCTASSLTACPSTLCFGAERCANVQRSPIALGPDGFVFAAARATDGTMVVLGEQSDGESDVATTLVASTSETGAVSWTTPLGNAHFISTAGSVAVDAGGGVWVARFESVHRMDESGAMIGMTSVAPGRVRTRRATAMVTGGVLVTGFVPTGAFPGQTAAGGEDAFVAHVRDDLSIAWTTQWGTDGDDRALAVTAHPDGGAYVVGATGLGPVHPPTGIYFLLRVAADGSPMWSRDLPSGEVADEAPVVIDGTDAVVATRDGSGWTVRRFDETGLERWAQSVDEIASVRSLTVDVTGRILVGALVGTPLAEQPVAVILDADGSELARHVVGLPGRTLDVLVDRDGERIIAGGEGGLEVHSPVP